MPDELITDTTGLDGGEAPAAVTTAPPADEFPSLDQVQSALVESKADPLKSAEVIRNWRNEAASQLDQHFQDPSQRNQAADKLDEAATTALRQQQGAAIDQWAKERFADDDQEAQRFLDKYTSAKGNILSIPDQYIGLASELYRIAGADQFKPTYETRNATGAIMAGPVKIGAFTTRELPHKGETQAFVTPITPGVEQPDIETAPKIPVTVPTPTADDIQTARKTVQDDLAESHSLMSDYTAPRDDGQENTPQNNPAMRNLKARMTEQEDKLRNLSGPAAKQYLTTERIRDRLKQPEYQGKIGQYAGGEEFQKGLMGAVFSAGALKARAQDLIQGGEKNLTEVSDARRAMEEAMPGSTRATFEGGFVNENVQALQRMGGEMLPYVAGAGVARAALGVADVAGSSVAARELAVRSVNASGVGAMGAGMGAGATGSAYAETQQQINEAEAAGDTARAAELRRGRDAHAVVTGLLMAGFSKMSPLHNFKTSGTTSQALLRDVMGQALEMPAMTATQGTLVDPIVGNHPDVLAQLPGAAFQGAVMAFAMGTAARLGEHLDNALSSNERNRQRAIDLAQSSGAADPDTIANTHEIHDNRAEKLTAEAKQVAAQEGEKIKATAAQMEFHNRRIDEIRAASTEGAIPEEPPMLPTAPKEDLQLYELRQKQAEQRALELQLMDVERDSTMSADDRAKMREPLIKQKTGLEIELMKLRRKLPEPHLSLETGKPGDQAPQEPKTSTSNGQKEVQQIDQGQESGRGRQEGQDEGLLSTPEVVVRPATAGAQGEPLPSADTPAEIQPPAQSAPAQTPPPESVAASDQSPQAAVSPSADPNIREPWVKNALVLAGQGRDQRGPLANALKVLTPSERAAAAERAGVKNPTLGDHILLAREMSEASGRPPPADPGAPQVNENPWGGGETTGIKNEVIDNERAAMGLPPMAGQASRTWGTLWDSASETLRNNPQAGYDRVASLKEKGGLHTDADAALLLRHKIELEHAAQLAAREINNPATTEEARQAAAERRGSALRALTDVHEVLRKAGTEVGRSLNARKMMMDRNEVPTVAEMEADRRIIKGRELTPDERNEVAMAHSDIEEAKLKLEAAEDADVRSAAVHEMQAVADDIAKQAEPAQDKPEPSKKVKDAQAKRDQRKKAGEEALQRLRDKGFFGRTNAILGVGEGELRDLAIYGHYVIGEGLSKLADFTAHMVEKFGETVREKIPEIFKSANAMSLDADEALAKSSKKARKVAGQSPVAIVEEAANGVKSGDAVDPSVARKLLEAHIREGVSGTDDLTHRLRESLSDVYQREVSDRDVWDAITGYGKVSKPSDDAVKKLAGAYRTEALLRRKLSAAQAKEAVLKTGPQRERATEEVRRLQRELNEEMRKNGYNATAEGQVRGRLDAIKQGLKNQIEDLESVIAGRQKLKPKGMPVDLDPETLALKDRLKALREHLATLPEFRAQLDEAENTRAIAAAKASRDEYNRRIREKEFEFAGKKDKKVSAELRRMRAERDLAAQSYRDAMAATDQGKAADMQRKIDAATKAVEAKEQELIDQKWTAKNPGRKLSDNPELKALQERSIELTKELQTQRYGDGMEAFTKWYTDRLATLRDSLAGIEAAKPPGRIVPDNAETKAMKAEIKELERLQREKRQPERDLKAMEERIRKMKDQIDNPDYSVKPKDSKELSPEMKSRQEYLDLLEQIHDNMQERDGTRANDRYRQNLEVRKARMDEDVLKGFPDKAKRVPLKLNEESFQAKKDFEQAKAHYEDLKHKDWLAKRSAFRRWSDRLVHISREVKLLNLIGAGQKLGGAGIENLMSAPVANAIAQFMRANKTLDAIRRKAVYEGSFTLNSNISGAKRMVGQWRAIFQKLRTGKSDIDWVNKDPHADGEMKSWIGQVHGMIKEPVRQFIYGKSMELRTAEALKQGVDFRTDKMAMAEASARAYEDANADIFMGDNRLTSAFRSAVTALRKSSKDTGAANTLADIMEIVFPIVNVPTNLAIRTARLSFGIPEAITRLGIAHARGDLADAAATMSPGDAELITKSLKYGVMGAGLAWYAWTHANQFGGVYSNTGDRPRDKNDHDLDPGDVFFKGTHLIAHGPIGTNMNYVADARRLYDKQMLKHPDHPISAASEAAAFMLLAPVSKLPFIDGLSRYFSSYKTAGQALGEAVKQNTIGGITEPILSRMDTQIDNDGKKVPVKRNPKNFIQELMMMVPSLRKEVPKSKHQPKAH